MGGEKVNNYTNEDMDIGAVQLTLDKVFKGFDMLSLTQMTTTTIPQIAAGSVFEVNGGLIKFDAAESISTTDLVTSSTVANGTVYVMIDGTTMTASFTATAPTWSDAKQGFYGTGDFANYRYVPICATKATAAYSNKRYIGYRNMKSLDFDDIDLTCDDITCDDITCDTMAATTFTGTWSGGDANVTHLNIGSGTSIHGLVAITGTAPATVSYPSGYTAANTYVLSIYLSDGAGGWLNINYGETYWNSIYVNLASDHIHVVENGLHSGTAYKMILART